MKKQRDHPVLFLRFKSIRPRYKPEAPPPAPEPICGLTHAVDQFPPRPHRIFFYSVLIHEITPSINVRILIKSVRTPADPARLSVQRPTGQPPQASPHRPVLLPVPPPRWFNPLQNLFSCRFSTSTDLAALPVYHGVWFAITLVTVILSVF